MSKDISAMVSEFIDERIKELLEENKKVSCCDKPEHNVLPKHPNDWRAVDNMNERMGFIATYKLVALFASMQATIEKLAKMCDVQLTDKRRAELVAKLVDVVAYQQLIAISNGLTADKGRGDAQEHYTDMTDLINDFATKRKGNEKEGGTKKEGGNVVSFENFRTRH